MATRIPKLMPHDVPAACGYFPQVRTDDEGFFVGETLESPGTKDVRQVISVKGIRELAKRIGLPTEKQLADANAAIASLTAQVERLEDELMEMDNALEGVDALTRRGLVVRKAPGRPKKTRPSQEDE